MTFILLLIAGLSSAKVSGESPMVSGVTDRRGTAATISYFQSPTFVRVDSGTERTRYQSIDASGRVGEVDDGDTTDTYLRQTVFRSTSSEGRSRPEGLRTNVTWSFRWNPESFGQHRETH